MNATSLCAVVITFHPPATVIENLEKLRVQVEGLVVVDNGSPELLRIPLRAAAGRLRFTLLENDRNAGIAAALNTGIRWARDRGFSCVLLFDQDSTVTGIFSRLMLTAYESHPQRDRLAVVTPSQVEKATGRRRGQSRAGDGGPLVAITSGSLMPTAIFDRCGWFQEELVIDCVDHEYCLRVRSLGFTLAECPEAQLLVAVGSGTSHQAFGLTISVRNYSAPRRYYLTRNRLVMVLRFWRQQPAWCCRALQDIVQDAIKIVLVEEERWSKTWNTARGIVVALCGRMGKVVEL